MVPASVYYDVVDVDGVPITYRRSRPLSAAAGRPTVLLLHGFPSGSHQFRRLIDLHGAEYDMLAPDYPGFGPIGTDFAGADGYPWTFDWIADVN